MDILHYPAKDRRPEEVWTQETLDMAVSTVELWQQAAGSFGNLHLHSCWGVSSVLDKRYAGESSFMYPRLMHLFIDFYNRFGSKKWKRLASSLVLQLEYLQAENGGFIHSVNEFEPNFTTAGCPIHYFSPVLALYEYYEWEAGDPEIKELIPSMIDRHWQFILRSSWGVGNGRFHPLGHPGWCGVTNQDLTAIAACARHGQVFGDWSRYEQYGKPTLDYILSPACYYEKIGRFERGDGVNFTERMAYYVVILTQLKDIYACVKDERIPPVIDNVCAHLLDGTYRGGDGMTHIARGAQTDPEDENRILGWDTSSVAFDAYPGILLHLKEYLSRHPEATQMREKTEELRRTLAAYVFADGSIPTGFNPKNHLFPIVTKPNLSDWIPFLLSELGPNVREPKSVKLPPLHRTYLDMVWKQNGPLWAVEKDGVRLYGGYTRYVAGITHGPEEKPVCGSFDSLEEVSILEQVEGTP